jgi:magnesium transporter
LVEPEFEYAETTPELLYLLSGDPAELRDAVAVLPAPDVAEGLDQLPPEAAARVLANIPIDLAVQVMDEPHLENRLEIFRALPNDVRPTLLDAMSADQQADLLRLMDDAERNRLLPRLDPESRRSLELLLGHAPETAGGIMTTEFVSVPETWTVEDTLRHIGVVGRAKETVYAIYVVDSQSRLVHVVSLRELLSSERGKKIVDIGSERPPLAVPVDLDREEVARLIGKYNLLAVPVCDDSRRILGIVTVDDVIDALVEEQTEDIQKFGGMEALGAPYLEVTLPEMIKKRAGWLAILFVGEMLTATAMGHFQDEIGKAVVLSLFIPLIISSGGNSGSQATTLVIRALAVGDIALKDWYRVLRRELVTGLSLGAILGAIGLMRITIWQSIGGMYGGHWVLLAMTVSCSLVAVVLWGSVAGSMLPFILRALGLDPASASAPFVATLVDVSGLIIYFTVASLFLSGTLL